MNGQESSLQTKGKLTYEELIRFELVGKNRAQVGYDSILWKIRAGYAVTLYGSLSLIATFTEKVILPFPVNRSFNIFVLLVLGFSAFAAFLDYSFLRSKLRVVDAKDQLSDLSLKLALGGHLNETMCEELEMLLHNSGETGVGVNWGKRLTSAYPPLVLYTGTSALAVTILYIIFFSA